MTSSVGLEKFDFPVDTVHVISETSSQLILAEKKQYKNAKFSITQ